MKNFLIIFLLNFCVINCYSQKEKSEIIYFLPSSVNDILSEEIQKKYSDKVYLVLDKYDSETYIIYLNKFRTDSAENIWINNSNRLVFLQKKLIPLYFYSDEYFSYAEKGEDVLKKLGTEKGIIKINNIRDNVFNIRFKLNGEIVK